MKNLCELCDLSERKKNGIKRVISDLWKLKSFLAKSAENANGFKKKEYVIYPENSFPKELNGEGQIKNLCELCDLSEKNISEKKAGFRLL